MDRLRYISVHNYGYILGSQCTGYLQQHKLVLTCVAWGADRKDAVLHILRLRRLKPLAWVLGEKCRHDADGYVCFGDGGVGRRHGGGRGGGCEKGMCVCVQNLV